MRLHLHNEAHSTHTHPASSKRKEGHGTQQIDKIVHLSALELTEFDNCFVCRVKQLQGKYVALEAINSGLNKENDKLRRELAAHANVQNSADAGVQLQGISFSFFVALLLAKKQALSLNLGSESRHNSHVLSCLWKPIYYDLSSKQFLTSLEGSLGFQALL
jgi:hypothetical protein